MNVKLPRGESKTRSHDLQNKCMQQEVQTANVTNLDSFGIKVLLTNEPKINICQNDGKKKVQREKRPKKLTTSSAKHGGGSLFTLTFMTASGAGTLSSFNKYPRLTEPIRLNCIPLAGDQTKTTELWAVY